MRQIKGYLLDWMLWHIDWMLLLSAIWLTTHKMSYSLLAYSLSFLPIGLIGEEKIDLNKSSQLEEYLENQCYDGKNCFRRICSHSTAGNFTALTCTLSEDNSFLLVQETISDTNGRILICILWNKDLKLSKIQKFRSVR